MSEATMSAAPGDEAAEEHGHGAIGRVGMATLILVESSFLLCFIVVYLFYIGKSIVGPYPHEVLRFPVLPSVVLLSSSVTIHWALGALKKDGIAAFIFWWAVTAALGAAFIGFTAEEWHELINEHHLTMSTNVFGSTYYTLVGAHAFHVVVGLILLLIVLLLAFAGRVRKEHHERCDLVSWYWHFVDVVWIAVVFVVYVVGVQQ